MNFLDGIEIPYRLLRGNRPLDPDFDEREVLFHRFNKLIDVDEHIYPSSIRFPDFSVNRSKYSEPYDILIPKYFDWGIFSFQVKDIPDPISIPGDKLTLYQFNAEHVPLEENYSHSEVRTSKDGVYVKDMKIKNKIIKKTFRFKLSDKATIIKYPD